MDIAMLCEAKGDIESAVRATEKALDIYTTCLGVDGDQAETTAKEVQRLKRRLSGGGLKLF